PLAEPTNLTARVFTSNAVILNWTAAPGATSYTIKRGSVSGGETVLATGVTSTAFVSNQLSRGRYYFVVTSSSARVESAASNEVSVFVSAAGVSSDFDGDGKVDIGVYRPSTGQWYVRYSSQGFSAAAYGAFAAGAPGDLPIAGDADGDHLADLVLYRPSTGE